LKKLGIKSNGLHIETTSRAQVLDGFLQCQGNS